MKHLLPTLLLLSAAALVPAPAQAHLCDLDDPACMAQCMLHSAIGGDPCSARLLDPPGFAPCAAGETGTVATVGSRSVRACTHVPDATVGSCAGGEVGVVVYVDGRATSLCASLA